MKKVLYISMSFMMFLAACKSKKMIGGRHSKGFSDTSISMLPEIRKALVNAFEFEYLSYKARCDYKDANMDQSFNMNFRMKYDSILWISISTVGFEVARARLDRDSVLLINRIEKKYYKYDYAFIQKLAGTSLSLVQIQHILTSNLLFPPQNFKATVEPLKFKTTEGYIENSLFLDAQSNITEQLIQHLVEQSSATILYSDYKKTDKQMFPGKIDVSVLAPNRNMSLLMENTGVSTEPILAFPFDIPTKYEKGN